MHYILNFAIILHRYLDRGLIELIGPMGLVRLFHYYSFMLELLSTGFIVHYALIIILFPIIIAWTMMTYLPASFFLLIVYMFITIL